MHLIHSVKNERADELQVWVEPWCHPYKVPPGSVLVFYYEAASEEAARVDTVLTPELHVLYFNTDYHPRAELDGEHVEPAWD